MPIRCNNLRARHAMLYLFAVTCLVGAFYQHGAFAQVDDEHTVEHPSGTQDSSAGSTSAWPADVTEHSLTSESERPIHSTNTVPTNAAETSSTPDADETDSRPAPRYFGDKGVIAIGGNLSVTSLNYSNSSASHFDAFAEPGFDYFIGGQISVGGYVLLTYSDQKGYDYFGPLIEQKETGYGFGARLGVNVALGKIVSVWPKFDFGITQYDTKYSVSSSTASLLTSQPGQRELTTHAFWVELYVPLLVHPVPHFFFGLGPSFFTDLSRSATFSEAASTQNKRTRVGLSLTTGGWL